MTAKLDNRAYYDDFAGWYERERGHGYHQMIDDLEVELIERYGEGGRVLEVGCGTGLLLQRASGFAARATGVDLSAGMLAQARERGLPVALGNATALPYADEAFDVVFSYKVLPHVAQIAAALAEMARVTRPGGYVLAELYNKYSLRYVVKTLKPASAVSERTTDEQVFTRYDSPGEIARHLPHNLVLEGLRGIRIITPISHIHRIPLVGGLVRRAEGRLADIPIVRSLGGFLIAIARKRG